MASSRYGISDTQDVVPRVKATARTKTGPMRAARSVQAGGMEGERATPPGGTLRQANKGNDKAFMLLVAGLVIVGALGGFVFHLMMTDSADATAVASAKTKAVGEESSDGDKPATFTLASKKRGASDIAKYRAIKPVRTAKAGRATIRPNFASGSKASRKKKSYAAAFKRFEALAQKGDADAQVKLAEMHLQGLGVDRNYASAERWYQRAADAGHSDGQAGLGWIYQMGLGVDRDFDKAVEHYRVAAELDSGWGQVRLGWLFQNGLGVEADQNAAASLYERAAKRGEPEGQAKLAWMFFKGQGRAKNDEKARLWARRSAEQGHPAGQNLLGWLLQQDASDDEAIGLFEQAAEQGFAQAQANLAWMYEQGRGVARSADTAARWLGQAVVGGTDPNANPVGVPIPEG